MIKKRGKRKKIILVSAIILIILFLCISAYFCYSYKIRPDKFQGIMILIEYKDTVGLANLVNDMEQRGINGLLMVTPEFVRANCEDIKNILNVGNVEIVALNIDVPFWGISYEEQKSRIVEMLNGIENCTGIRPRIISSRYMASDLNTVKVAEELSIPFITARGTTETKATVYQPEGYNVKILSISNIPWVPFEYGSLCDYSFYERAGTPEDMKEELNRALEPLTEKEKERFGEYQRITPVSHTNIGGYLKQWNDMWIEYFDNSNIKWVGLDEFMEKPDWTIPLWQIPINQNNPYTEEKVHPLIPYEDEEKVNNPCAVTEIVSGSEQATGEYVGDKLVMFHNGKGTMCLEAIDFIRSINYSIEQYLDSEEGFYEKLNRLKAIYKQSEGVSENFGYYPIIFIKDKSYSGFNSEIKKEILEEIK